MPIKKCPLSPDRWLFPPGLALLQRKMHNWENALTREVLRSLTFTLPGQWLMRFRAVRFPIFAAGKPEYNKEQAVL